MKWRNDGAGERELADLHALAGREYIADFAKRHPRTLHEDDFHNVVTLELHLQRANHFVEVPALEASEVGQDGVLSLAVEKSDCAGHDGVACVLAVLDQAFRDHRGEGL